MAHYSRYSADVYALITIVTCLLILGVIFVYSSSSVYASEMFANAHYFVKKQIFGIALGIACAFFMQCVPARIFYAYAPLFLAVTTLLTLLTLVPGISRQIHGSSRWLTLAGFSFQPSELLKPALLLYLASFLERKQMHTTSGLRAYSALLMIIGIISIVLLRQPDFGLTVTLCITVALTLFAMNFHLKYLAAFAASALPLALILILAKPYRMRRIMVFLDPWNDPKGAGFQIIQSLIAIGSGGAYGVGIAQSKQKFFYLPMQHTDFIFSIIAEEIGFMGSALLIGLYVLFAYFGIRLALRLTTAFAQCFTFGFVSLISLQAFINIAVATGLAPTKGIGLPFVSYGNTSIVCLLLTFGIVISLARTSQTATLAL